MNAQECFELRIEVSTLSKSFPVRRWRALEWACSSRLGRYLCLRL